MKNGEYLAYCPCDRHKNKPKLSVREENGTVLAHCLAGCPQDRVWQEMRNRVFPNHVHQPGHAEPEEKSEPWPEWLPEYPGGWEPISQKSRDAIAGKRKDYTPGVEALRNGGVVEAAGKFVCFPCRVGDDVRNLRVLDFTKPKDAWQFWQYRPGPKPGTKIPPDTSVLFNLKLVDLFAPLYIVEGQWDCLTMEEAGLQVVSLLSASQCSISKAVLEVLDPAPFIFLCPDNDGGTGDKAFERLAQLFPADRAAKLSFGEWNVKDACALRSKCADAEQFKAEIERVSDVIEDASRDAVENPEHADYLDRLQTWDGSGPMPVPAVPSLVTDKMSDEAFYGIAGDYIRSLKENSEASQEGMLVLFLAAFSSMVGHRAWTRVEETIHHPNLFAIVAGQSARARKDTGMNRVIKPLKLADERWAKLRKYNFQSGEALVSYFAEHESDPRLFMTDTEFASTLSVCGRKDNNLSPRIRNLYDSAPMEITVKKSTMLASRTTGSWLGLITLGELKLKLAEVELSSGFINRFLVAVAKRSRKLPFGGNPVDVSRTVQGLQKVLTWLDSSTDGGHHIRFSEDASPIWIAFYHGLPDNDPDFLTRAEANTMRLAMNYAILDCSSEIGPDHLRAALAVWDYCAKSAQTVFGEQSTPDVNRLAAEVRRLGSMTRTLISRFFNGNKTAGQLDEISKAATKHGGLRLKEDGTLYVPTS
jgi:hypothetical protein